MRTRVAVAVAAVGLLAVSAASGAPARTPTRLPRSALVPNAVAFRDRMHGMLGTGWEGCVNRAWHCKLQGTISVTSDGGKTWRVVRWTPRPVVAVAFFHDVYYAQLDNGRLVSGEPGSRSLFKSYCPKGWSPGVSADLLGANLTRSWSICTEEPGAGNQAKAVYRGKKRVAYTPMGPPGGYGGISSYGYLGGIAGTYGGFGIIWESRGTLYVTHDGGHHWRALPKVARPEIDFGQWADADLGNGTAFVLLAIGGSETRRLIETTDAGRTWRVVHRWRGPVTP